MVKILITGAGGFIGSRLIKTLLKETWITSIECYDNLMYNKNSLLSYAADSRFIFTKGDVRDSSKLHQSLKRNDIIISLAALVGASLCEKNQEDTWKINYLANRFLANNKSNDQALIYPNTNSGYGITDGKTEITEQDLLNPISSYGKSKCEAEEAIRLVDNHIIFRLATVFGSSPRMRTDLLVNNLVFKALKDSYIVLYENQAMRNYVHIQDVCDAFIFSILNWDTHKNEVYNFGNDKLNMSKLDLCNEINKTIPFEIIKAEYTKDCDKRNYAVSSKKFYNKGFKECVFDIEYGVKELLKAYNMIEDDFIVHANY